MTLRLDKKMLDKRGSFVRCCFCRRTLTVWCGVCACDPRCAVRRSPGAAERAGVPLGTSGGNQNPSSASVRKKRSVSETGSPVTRRQYRPLFLSCTFRTSYTLMTGFLERGFSTRPLVPRQHRVGVLAVVTSRASLFSFR